MLSALDQLQLLTFFTLFTQLDLCNAYHLVRVRESEWEMGFNTPNGHYKYLVMPFGLTNIAAVGSRQ